jgi:hypothetical protein
VRVSDFVLKCVGFVGEVHERDANDVVRGDLHATGFFVCIPSAVRHGLYYLYFVTARHVAEELRNVDVYVLVNKRGGGTTEILASEPANWYLHPTDLTCDVAVCPMVYSPPAELLPVPFEHLLTPKSIEDFGIGIGDEVFATGLFSEIPNTTKNIPILRHGNIAMMPTEQLQTELGYADVYLVEARSLGGLSGSPVFVRPTGKIPVQLQPGTGVEGLLAVRDRIKLLGLMHGHWDVKESEINNPTITHDRKRGVNYGVAIVTPAIKIIETLNRPDLLEVRMGNEEALKRSGIPGMDSASSKDSDVQTTETGFELPVPTDEQFFDGLKKASRKKHASRDGS